VEKPVFVEKIIEKSVYVGGNAHMRCVRCATLMWKHNKFDDFKSFCWLENKRFYHIIYQHISIVLAQLSKRGGKNPTVFHMNLINWLIHLVEFRSVQEFYGEKVAHHSDCPVRLAIFLKQLLDFFSPLSHICRGLS